MADRRLGLLVGVSVVFMMLVAGCASREERITLTASTAATTGATSSAGRQSATPTPTDAPAPPPTATPTRASMVSATEAQGGSAALTAVPPSPTPTSLPTATPTPGSFGPPGDGLAVVTLGEQGRTALLHPGDRLVLTLGDGYVWTLRVSGVEVLVPLATSMLPPGTQAVFQARKVGKAIVGAVGQPICRPGWTHCSTNDVQFELTVIVG
ncbi:MAG TPA: hypothetical protein VJQ83_02100 [Tepidiformaceae bacterium]|nr:hypothetical protein [Tepidiformaceae bacterium]